MLFHPDRGMNGSLLHLFNSAQMLPRSLPTVISCSFLILFLPLLCLLFSVALVSLGRYAPICSIFLYFIRSKTPLRAPQRKKKIKPCQLSHASTERYIPLSGFIKCEKNIHCSTNGVQYVFYIFILFIVSVLIASKM